MDGQLIATRDLRKSRFGKRLLQLVYKILICEGGDSGKVEETGELVGSKKESLKLGRQQAGQDHASAEFPSL